MIDFKLLIVERSDEMRDVMVTTLSKSFKVDAAKDGQECLKIIETSKPELVLIDYHIQDMSSIELQQEIAKKYPDVHTAMISNIDRTKVSLESLKRRAMDYIYRSDDEERFLSDVCKLVRYIIDIKYKIPKDAEIIASGFYELARKLYDEKKWTVDDIERMLAERKDNQ